MATRPTDVIEFATVPTETPVDPGLSKKQAGWLTDEAPPAAWFSWFFRAWYRWINWLTGNVIENRATQWRSKRLPLGATFTNYVGIAFDPYDRAFAAVGNTGKPAYSLDNGETWLEIAGTTFDATSICFDISGPSGFMAVANNGNTYFSGSGGVTWSAKTALGASNTWNSICSVPRSSGNYTLVVVGATGANRIARSADGGNTWSLLASPEANAWRSVCASRNRIIVAVSSTGTNRVMRSTDRGLTWAAVAAAAQNSWRSVCSGVDRFVAVSHDGTNRVMHSVDGLMWVSAIAPLKPWVSVCWDDNWSCFIAVSNDDVAFTLAGDVMTSADGITWQLVSNVYSPNGGLAAVCSNALPIDAVLSPGDFSLAPKAVAVGPVCIASTGGTIDSNIPGTTIADSARAGIIGEAFRIDRLRSASSALPLTTNAVQNQTGLPITLTPGDWEVKGSVGFLFAATTNYTQLIAAVSLSSGALPATDTTDFPTGGAVRHEIKQAASVPTAGVISVPIPAYRVTVAAGTTITLNLLAQATFTVSTLSSFGYLEARRAR